MYKFKCCIETENEISAGPLLFSQLETITNGLINDTLELKQEFGTKMEFVNEQFLKVYKNEQEIINLFNMLMTVQQQFSNLEEELKGLECLLKQFANIVQHLEISSKMETFCLRNICGCGQCRFCCCKTERQHFMELLEETNHKLEAVPSLLEDMLELRSYEKLNNPFTKVSIYFKIIVVILL